MLHHPDQNSIQQHKHRKLDKLENIYNQKNYQSKISAEAILDINSKFGVGGIKLTYRF